MLAPKISIIVPVYNVEQYLSQCLDSIVCQTLHDIEIITIDDGSTDGSLEILQKYASKDKRIKLVSKKNEGYGQTLNRGLDLASGKYVGIVESDDWIDLDAFENLYDIAEQNDCQVVKSDWYFYYKNLERHNIKANLLPPNDLNHIINPKEKSDIFYVMPSIWSAIYRRDFLNKNKIRFLCTPGASYQDTSFNFKVWATADSVYLTSEAYLHYRQNTNTQSISSTGKVFCVCDEWKEIERFVSVELKKRKESFRLINHVKLLTYMWNLNRLSGIAKNLFLEQFTKEYKEAFYNNGLNKDCFDQKSWTDLMLIIFPNSKKYRFIKKHQKLIKLFFNTKIKRNKKRYYIIYGLVEIYKKRIKRPNFMGTM